MSTVSLQAAATADGNGSSADITTAERIVVDVSGTFIGRVNFEARLTGGTWRPIVLNSFAYGAAGGTSSPGAFTGDVKDYDEFRARISDYVSGSITVTSRDDDGLPTLDNGPAWTTVWGVTGVPYTSADRSASAAPVTDLPASGQKLVITDLIISVDTAMTVTLTCETSGAVVFGPYYLPANGTVQITPRGKKKLATANKRLQVQTSVAGHITVEAGYYSEL
jgi:hypothetical protein